MAKIGTFTKSSSKGFNGRITTLAFSADLEIVPAEQKSEKAPDYRVYSQGSEVGAAWSKTSEAGEPYISLKLDDLSFSAPIYLALLKAEAENEYSLLWQRASDRS
jgi:uncharacterized protein (DUF736 family)